MVTGLVFLMSKNSLYDEYDLILDSGAQVSLVKHSFMLSNLTRSRYTLTVKDGTQYGFEEKDNISTCVRKSLERSLRKK